MARKIGYLSRNGSGIQAIWCTRTAQRPHKAGLVEVLNTTPDSRVSAPATPQKS